MFFKFHDPLKFELISCKKYKLYDVNLKSIIDKIKCVKLIEDNFQYYSLMESILCFIQLFLYTYEPISKNQIPYINEKMRKMIQNDKKKGKSGVSGEVFLSKIFNLFNIIIKTPKNIDSFTDILHEYIIGIYAINKLRILCPNFCYTFAIYNNNINLGNRIIIENINGDQLSEYLKSIVDKPITQNLKNEFLKIFIQIILALEIAQESALFAHYDLHADNILLRRLDNDINLKYNIFNKEYILKNIDVIATIIDFGHSSAYTNEGIIGKGFYNSYPIYGMYNFYIPGVDLFKLFTFIMINIFMKKMKNNTMGFLLKQFFFDILNGFFEIQMINNNQPNYIDPSVIIKKFYDGTNKRTIFRSPFDFLNYLDENKHYYLNLFKIPDYPWIIKNNPRLKIKSIITHTDELNKCFSSLFCSHIKEEISLFYDDLFPFSWNEEKVSLDEFKIINIILKKYSKIITPSGVNLSDYNDIIFYLQDLSLWENFYNCCNKIITDFQLGSLDPDIYKLFFPNIKIIIHYYRIYACLKSYLSNLKYMYKIPIDVKFKNKENKIK